MNDLERETEKMRQTVAIMQYAKSKEQIAPLTEADKKRVAFRIRLAIGFKNMPTFS